MPSRNECRSLLKKQKQLESKGWFFAIDQPVIGTTDGTVKAVKNVFYAEGIGPNLEHTPKISACEFWEALAAAIQEIEFFIKQAQQKQAVAKKKKKAKVSNAW